jgi:hypothetical protein
MHRLAFLPLVLSFMVAGCSDSRLGFQIVRHELDLTYCWPEAEKDLPGPRDVGVLHFTNMQSSAGSIEFEDNEFLEVDPNPRAFAPDEEGTVVVRARKYFDGSVRFT